MKRTCGRWIPIVSVVLLCPGCLVRDVTHTVYLEPDGSVTWTVLEQHVRSDGETPSDRAREEGGYINAINTDGHQAARAFAKLDPTDVHTTVLRAERPYATLVEARFARVDELMGTLGSKLGVGSDSTLERRDGLMSWTLTIYPAPMSPSRDEDVDPLIDFFSSGTLMIVTGRFTSAVGFELSADRRAATVQITKDILDDDSQTEPLRFSLTWAEADR